MNRPLKVLILEDVQADAELMVHELKNAGFLPDWIRVDTENSYLTALASGPDLILSDFNLPQFDAFLALQLMQMQKLDIPFIVISGAISEDTAVEFMKRGASDYLLKDRMARLGQAVVMALEQRELREKKRRTEEALRESEEKYRILIENSHDIIYTLTPEGTFTFVSPGWTKLLGHHITQVIGKSFQQFVHPDDIAECRTFLRAVIETGQRQTSVEYRVLHADGSWHWHSSNAVPFRDKTGMIVGFQGSARDITERKRAEEALIKKSEDLARSNADLAQFAYVANHDLQEPLRMVTSYVQLLEMRYKSKLDPDADEFIGYIVEGTKRMKQLLSALLDCSRVGTGGHPLQTVECERVLENALQNLRMVLDETRGTVTHDPLPAIMADETQMVQLFQNLIGNGLKFHGPKPPLIHISAKQEAANWIFSFQDNGIGIDPQYFEKIFVIFQRLHARDKYPGNGIGLTIAKKIVERHGGHIWVESVKESGTAFYFTVPCNT